MYSAQMKVRRFHELFKCKTAETPNHLKLSEQELRVKLMREELKELDTAMALSDMVGVADGIADLLYVTLGTAVAYGINIDPIFETVHNSNMDKLGGALRPDGKILKPPGWVAPNDDIRLLLLDQGWKP